MKTARDGYANAFQPYTQSQVDLILSQAPTERNRRMLASVMGRSRDAIGMIYEIAYGTNILRRLLARTNGEAIGGKIVKAKKKLGLLMGHRP